MKKSTKSTRSPHKVKWGVKWGWGMEGGECRVCGAWTRLVDGGARGGLVQVWRVKIRGQWCAWTTTRPGCRRA